MPNFRCNGSAGASVITSFLPPIPARFTVLTPGHNNGSLSGFVDSQVAANNVNLFTPYNTFVDTGSGTNAATVSFGALTTAPDGTNTGQHMTEAANTGIHAAQAILPMVANKVLFSNRFGVIAKAAERTRMKLSIIASIGGPANEQALTWGCKAIFDLAGGQVGVANATFNVPASGQAVAGPSAISPLGNGWYLCTMDMLINSTVALANWTGIVALVSIDSGSGTNAESSSYAGDGASGINIWKTSMLPPAAWGMSGQVIFFDDFTDPAMASIDTNNTGAPGFKWYPNQVWPTLGFRAADGMLAMTPGSITQSGSQITIPPNSNPANACFGSAVYGGTDGTHVGNVFQIPAVFEIRRSLGAPVGVSFNTRRPAFWTNSVERLQTTAEPHAVEMDFTEPSLWPYGLSSFFSYMGGGTFNAIELAQTVSWAGLPLWLSGYPYDPSPPVGGGGENSQVSAAGVAYNSLVLNNLGNAPASSPSDWATISLASKNTGSILTPDFTQMHTYTTLVLPADQNNIAHMMTFMDDIPCTTNLVNNHNDNAIRFPFGVKSFPPSFASDHYPILIGGGETGTSIDWVRVTQ